MNLAAKSAVMNTLRRTSKQVIPQTQPVSIAVHQPPVPVGPTVATKGTSTRGMSMVDQIKYKEKAEEDRYMRQLEAKHYKHQVQQQEQDLGHGKKTAESIEELKLYWERIEPVMNEVRETVLQSTGDVVSDEGLEALARWKLGLM